ncbi:hypothetical protein [Thermomonospora cellulosilytica]|uniref:Uncharacterized protein n=1 Tax=Thermomonospora cellulosilytica TaxID=1411118 RepID=A0A7W3R720_9ACTN|nr:hypothetical protein [Thermomonospora cellulosilytica]MBA9002024.1 hypothetical protein [Thermomonospora cellulosilytica]
MTDHRMTLTAAVLEVEPTEPDAQGHRWRRCEAGPTIAGACTCGLVITGPRPIASPLIRQHAGH